MSPLERDRHLLSQILEYYSKIERTVARFGFDQNVFEHDEDYIDSVSMNLLQNRRVRRKAVCRIYSGFQT